MMALLRMLLASAIVVNGVSCQGSSLATFIFGDSLVDVGNNNYLMSLATADVPPNGIDFAATGGRPTGRFTNGRTIPDVVKDELVREQIYAPPFLAPSTEGPAILHGVNYASGGGGILNETGKIFINRIGMDVQIDFFDTTRKELDALMGNSRAKDFLAKSTIFLVCVGSNDFLSNYLLPLVSIGKRTLENPEDFIARLIDNFRSQLVRLYNLDARKFLVSNIGPIGCLPIQKSVNRVDGTACAAESNLLATQYNERLKDLITELSAKLPEATFVLANVYDLTLDIITNYRDYGFETASVPCCQSALPVGLFPCNPSSSSVCPDRSKHFFWDVFHPTEAANVIIAKLLVDGDTKYVFPMNVRQLLNL